MRTAFVLGGGGVLGAHEVGMLRALSEASIRPDVIVGTSVGAVNGVFVAADPAGAAERLSKMWLSDAIQQVFSETLGVVWSGWRVRARTCIRSSRCAACWTTCFRGTSSPILSCLFSALRPASNAHVRAGSAAGRSCLPCWPRVRYLGCCHLSRSTASTTSTAASSIPSRLGDPSPWVPALSMFCTQAGSSARWRCLAVRGRWALSLSRSLAGIDSLRRCRRCPPRYRYTFCPQGAIGARQICHSFDTATRLGSDCLSSVRTQHPRAISPS